MTEPTARGSRGRWRCNRLLPAARWSGEVASGPGSQSAASRNLRGPFGESQSDTAAMAHRLRGLRGNVRSSTHTTSPLPFFPPLLRPSSTAWRSKEAAARAGWAMVAATRRGEVTRLCGQAPKAARGHVPRHQSNRIREHKCKRRVIVPTVRSHGRLLSSETGVPAGAVGCTAGQPSIANYFEPASQGFGLFCFSAARLGIGTSADLHVHGADRALSPCLESDSRPRPGMANL